MKTHVWTTASGVPGRGAGAKMPKWRLYLAVILLNIVSFTAGTVFGWSSPILPLLQSPNPPVDIPPITDSDASWLASVYSPSRLLTIPLYKYSIDRLGRKVTGYLVAVPYVVSYVTLLFATSFDMLFWGRFIVGLAVGGTFILVPTFTSDIAEDDNKGMLGVMFGLSMDLGMCFSYAMAYLTSYTVFHICCTLLPVAFVLVVWWLPESPLFLMTVGKVGEAKDSLAWYRNGHVNELEMQRMKMRAEEVLEKRKKKLSFSEVTNTSTVRGFLICTGLVINKCLNGFGPVTSFTVQIFQEAGSTLSPNIATIIIGVMEIFGSLISCVIVEKSGRRFLLITSNIATALCMAVLGTHFYLQSLGWNMEYFGWVPIVTLSMFVLSNGAGISPLPFLIPTEIVHSHYLGVLQSTNMMFISILFFSVTLSYTPLANCIGQYGCFWLFAFISIFCTLCIFLTLPETKNRSTEEVLEQLRSKNYIRSVLRWRAETKDVGG